MTSHKKRWLFVLFPAVVATTAVLAEVDDYPFIPPGGRAILSGIMAGQDAQSRVAVAGREDDMEGWAAWVRAGDPDLPDDAVETFAGYAELNFPVGVEILELLGETGDMSLLPADGKDLAAKVEFARSYAKKLYEREMHDQLLNEVLAADPYQEGYTLSNVLAQEDAVILLAEADDYF